MTKFYEAVLQAILRCLDFSLIKCIILASPGFTKDQFYDYMMQETVRRDLKIIMDNKTKFVKCHSHSGHKRALQEIFANPEIVGQLHNVKATAEVSAMNLFYKLLREDNHRAIYGLKRVNIANDNEAIESLLISEDLFRSEDFVLRKKYVDLVESVRAHNGEVFVFSTLHVSGDRKFRLSIILPFSYVLLLTSKNLTN